MDHIAHIASLAHHPNLYVKWCHAPSHLSAEPYPFTDLAPLFRTLVDAYGAQRIIWASDFTVSKVHHSWAQGMHFVLDSPLLSAEEKEWIVGKTARTILRLPAP